MTKNRKGLRGRELTVENRRERNGMERGRKRRGGGTRGKTETTLVIFYELVFKCES